MACGKYNFTIKQGSTFRKAMTFYTDETQSTTIDFTGYSWRMQIRATIDSNDVIQELTSAGGEIDISNQSEGVIVLNLTATETAALSFDEGVYDLEAVNGVDVDRKLYGNVTLSKEVTR